MNNVVTAPSYPTSANPVRKLVVVLLALMVGGGLSVHGAGKQKAAKRQKKDALLERYDVNHNGALDADERAAVEKDFLDRFDKDGDKKLDKSELDAVRQEVAKQASTNLRKRKK